MPGLVSAYDVVQDSDSPQCIGTKITFPGEEELSQLITFVSKFVSKQKSIIHGGWAIHHFLTGIDKDLMLYDEENVCDVGDVDLFGYLPVEDLVELAHALKQQFPKYEFFVETGIHPNQFIIKVNYLGYKMVDKLYICKDLFEFLPTLVTKDKKTILHPVVELMRQYFMVSNFALFPPGKDIAKIVKRIKLLEEHALLPWLKEKGLWDARKLSKYNIPIDVVRGANVGVAEKIIDEWFKSKISVCEFKTYDGQSMSPRQFVIFDANFQTDIKKLHDELHQLPFETKEQVYNAFMGIIGPMYNGWMEIHVDDVHICSVYSMATPVHLIDKNSKVVSYFLTMAHCIWMHLYAEFSKRTYLDMLPQAVRWIKLGCFKAAKDDKRFDIIVDIKYVNGKFPMRNFFMAGNIMRKKYMLRISSQEKKIPSSETIKKFYRDFDGSLFQENVLGQIKLKPRKNKGRNRTNNAHKPIFKVPPYIYLRLSDLDSH